ncbi:GntR family transcriptional regulator [Microbacterium sp. MAHUQ-60]|uniref:GntR family transcriptional regulator n=1 Tax=unclassified Microbacterium TaxID=2609290 RepID=UPI00361A8B4B
MAHGSQQFHLATASLTDALYESVRSRIISGDFRQGEKLTESRIATDYNVARTTAKACLERLIGVGLLIRSAHRSALIPTLGPAEIQDLFLAREAIEAFAVSRLAGASTVPATALEAHERLKRAASSESFDQQVEADVSFHTALIQATDSARLSRMHELIMGEVHLSMGQYRAHQSARPTTIVQEHNDILEAIAAGDADTAQRHMALHLRNAKERLLSRADGVGTGDDSTP